MPQPMRDDRSTLSTEKYELVKGKITPDDILSRRLPRYRWLAEGDTQEVVSGKKATLRSVSEPRG